jgi:KaiC/GvpD/RAD55 family RecA-like ATPase
MAKYTGPSTTDCAPNEAMMTDHLGSWFGNVREGQIDIGWMNIEKGGITNFKRFDVGDFDEAAAFAAKTNAVPGQSVYYRPAVVKPDAPQYVKDEDVMIAPGVWVDLDTPGAVGQAKKVYTEAGLPPTSVVVTGREPETRAHLYWAFSEFRGAGDIIKRMNQSLCTAMNGDPASVNVSRLMRLGGTIAWPWKEGREPEMTSFQKINKGGPYSDLRLKAAWPIEQPKLEIVPSIAPSGDPLGLLGPEGVDLKAISELILKGENWHLNMVRATGYMVEAGRSTFEIQMFCRNYTLPGYTDADTDREVLKAINGARDKWGTPDSDNLVGEGHEDAPPPDITANELGDFNPMTIPTRPWLFGDQLLTGYVTAFVAPPGVGKSTLTILIAIAVAQGMEFAGHLTHKQGKVWLYNNEDDMPEMRRRIAAGAQTMDVSIKDISTEIFVNTGDERALMVAKTDKNGNVTQTPDIDGMIAEIKKRDIKLLIIDPFAETHAVNENSNDDIKQVAMMYRRIAKKCDCAVLLVHHTRKTASGMDGGVAGNMDSARGAGAFTGVCRVVSTLFGMSKPDANMLAISEDERHLYIRFDNAKANLSLITHKAQWFARESVEIANGEEIGILKPWIPPGPFEGVTSEHLHKLQNMVAHAEDAQDYYLDSSRSKTRWIGIAVKEACGLDDDVSNKRIALMVTEWVKQGRLQKVEIMNKDSKERLSIIVGELVGLDDVS